MAQACPGPEIDCEKTTTKCRQLSLKGLWKTRRSWIEESRSGLATEMMVVLVQGDSCQVDRGCQGGCQPDVAEIREYKGLRHVLRM